MDPHFDGVIFQTHAEELRRRLRYPHPPFRVLDVRDLADHARGHIPSAVLAGPEIAALPPGTTPHTELIVVGAGPDDARVRATSLALRRLGAHRVVEMVGGMHEWGLLGMPTERAAPAAA
jgi:rhodanese-related sulfurtransferase